MASVGQAYRNITKYGVVPTIVGSIKQPGGFLGSNSTTGITPSTFKATSTLRPVSAAAPLSASVPPAPTTSNLPAPSDSTQGIDQFTNETGGSGTGTATQQFQQYYNGQLYTDPHTYYQALLATATKSHADAVKQANQAYEDGLISYDQRQEAISKSRSAQNTALGDIGKSFENTVTGLGNTRKSNLGSISGYFSSISPHAYQTQQGTSEELQNKYYAEDLVSAEEQRGRNVGLINENISALDQEEQNLGRSRQTYTQELPQVIAGLDQQLKDIKDQYMNAELTDTPETATQDPGFTNNLSGGSTSVAQTQLNDYATSIGINPRALTQLLTGVNLNNPKLVQATLGNAGLTPEQTTGILQYIYGS